MFFFFFFFNDTATTEIYTLSLHDALPISRLSLDRGVRLPGHLLRGEPASGRWRRVRSEEHTSELQSPCNLVCRLLLEKKKKNMYSNRQRIDQTETFVTRDITAIYRAVHFT